MKITQAANFLIQGSQTIPPRRGQGDRQLSSEMKDRLDKIFQLLQNSVDASSEDVFTDPTLSARHATLVTHSFSRELTSSEVEELKKIRLKFEELEEMGRQHNIIKYLVEGVNRLVSAKIKYFFDSLDSEENLPKSDQLKNAETYLTNSFRLALEHYPKTSEIKVKTENPLLDLEIRLLKKLEEAVFQGHGDYSTTAKLLAEEIKKLIS